MIEVSFTSIFFAGLAATALAIAWFHPKSFGTAWAALARVKEDAGKQHLLAWFWWLLATMLVAYVMSYFALAWGVMDWIGAIELGFWCWIGFSAPSLFALSRLEQKPLKLYLIGSLYWLVAFIAMALILVG